MMDYQDSPSKRRRVSEAGNSIATFLVPKFGPNLNGLENQAPTSQQNQLEAKLFEFETVHLSVCVALNLPESMKRDSKTLLGPFGRALHGQNPNTSAAGVVACAIWVTVKVTAWQSKQDNGITVSQILLSTNSYITEFLMNLLSLYKANAFQMLSQEYLVLLQKDMMYLQNDFNALSYGHTAFKELFHAFFKADKPAGTVSAEYNYLMDIFHLSWLLMLVSRDSLFPPSAASNKNFALILGCCIHFILHQVTVNTLRDRRDVAQLLHLDLSEDQLNSPNFYKLIFCQKLNINYESFVVEEPKFLAYLEKDFVCSKAFSFSTISQCSDGFPFLEGGFGLSDRMNYWNTKELLNKKYTENLHLKSGAFDGRYFLSRTAMNAITPKKFGILNGLAVTRSPVARNLKQDFAKASLMEGKMRATPLSAKSMNTNNIVETDGAALDRLRKILQQQELGLLPHTKSFLSTSPDQLESQVCSRIQQALEYFSKVAIESERCYIEMGLKVYLRTLELMIVSEQAGQVKRVDLHAVMQNGHFHRNLMACCIHLICDGFKASSITRQTIETFLVVTAYHYCLIIDILIKHVGKFLTWSMIKDLKYREERVLDTYIWKHDAPIYTQLELEQKTSGDAFNFLSSPRKALRQVNNQQGEHIENMTISNSVESSNDKSVANNQSYKDMEVLFRKIFRLVRTRMQLLVSSIGAPDEVFQMAWDIISEMLVQEAELRLFYKRNVDQIIICTIYSACRYLSFEITMHSLIQNYNKQPQADSNVTNSVRLDDDKRDIIIVFYNELFVTVFKRVKKYIESVGKSSEIRLSNGQGLCTSNEKKLSPKKFAINPVQEVCMTPRTSRLQNKEEEKPLKRILEGGRPKHGANPKRKLTFSLPNRN